MSIKTIVVIFSSIILVAGCSGGGGGGGSTSLSDIVGVWDASTSVGQMVDEGYMVIKASGKENGTLVYYDYDGDSYDLGSNCYYKEQATIRDLGSGNFEVTDSYTTDTVKFSLSGNKLTISVSNTTQTLTRSSLQESDFSPLC